MGGFLGVKLSKTKTIGIIFNNSNCITNKFNLILNNDKQTQFNKIKFLGLVFDQNLQFNSHIEGLIIT